MSPTAVDDDAPDPHVKTWADLERSAAERLDAVAGSGAAREARWLVEEVRGVASGAPTGDHRAITAEDRARFDRLVTRRATGEPLQYVLGHWSFRTIEVSVDPRALIPRPETEQAAGVALAELHAMGVGEPVVVDLGTGSGVLGLSIAVEHPSSWVLGVEASPPALELASQNRERVGLDVKRMAFAGGSWFSGLPDELRGVIDLIVTNPPYVAIGDQLDPVVRDFEPAEALFAGEDGLDDLRIIIDRAPGWLATHGVLVAEIGATQAAAVIALAHEAGFATAEVRPDLSGRDRILVARRTRPGGESPAPGDLLGETDHVV